MKKKATKKHKRVKGKHLLVIVPAVALVAAFGVGLGARMLAGSDGATRSSSSYSERCDGHCVDLAAGKAAPSSLSVPVGEYVQFNNSDGGEYNISLGRGTDTHAAAGEDADKTDDHGDSHAEESEDTSKDHDHDKRFVSGDIGEGKAWRVQMKQAGTYYFHDHYDPDLTILVVAYEPGAEYRVE